MRCPWAHWGGGEVRQLLEIGESDYSHTITTVDKDNYVLETETASDQLLEGPDR